MNLKRDIGRIDGASIGGSGTWSISFPESIDSNIDVEYYAGCETAYGRLAPFKILDIGGAKIFRIKFHGVERAGDIARGALQVGWALRELETPWAIIDASVGGICPQGNEDGFLPPWSVMIPNDYYLVNPSYWFKNEILQLQRDQISRLAQPFNLALRQHLFAASQVHFEDVYWGGNYACTPPGPFETACEIEMYRRLGFNWVGRTLGYEAWVARVMGTYEIAAVNISSNDAEGRADGRWSETAGGMKEFYAACGTPMGNVTLDALQSILEGPAIEPTVLDAFDREDFYLEGTV